MLGFRDHYNFRHRVCLLRNMLLRAYHQQNPVLHCKTPWAATRHTDQSQIKRWDWRKQEAVCPHGEAAPGATLCVPLHSDMAGIVEYNMSFCET